MKTPRATYGIGHLLIDEVGGTIGYGAKTVGLPPRCLLMLRILSEQQPGTLFTEATLRKRIRPRKGRGATIRSIASLLRKALRELKLPDSLPSVEGTPKRGYCLVLTSSQPATIELVNPSTTSTSSPSPKREFSFLIDGMIIDIVAELLMHNESMIPVMNRSRETYRRGLEDFAFSIVYASSITSATDILDRSSDPGRYSRADITSQLGHLWQYHEFDRDLKNGAILESNSHRDNVRKHIKAAGHCIMRTDWPFRDWLSGEVSRHLGHHESLFEEGLSPHELVFKVGDTLSNYKDVELQSSFGEDATNRAIGLLRDATRGSEHQYSTGALREFATASIVSLVTIMLENDISAQRKEIWRMPHLLRSLVKQQVLFDWEVQQQIHLKSIITQHALAAALRQVEDLDRHSFITVLSNMRDESPFKDIREILEIHRILLSQSSREEDESKARFILKEIRRLADSPHAVSEIFTLGQGSALRALDKVRSDQYEAQLHRVFPALKPTYLYR